jgi:hypothetical protein
MNVGRVNLDAPGELTTCLIQRGYDREPIGNKGDRVMHDDGLSPRHIQFRLSVLNNPVEIGLY